MASVGQGGGFAFVIEYGGGDGNDVVIQSIPGFIWSGLGADDNWTTDANWVGGAAPVPGPTVNLIFDGLNRQTNINDFGAGAEFGGIGFSGGGFVLLGDSILLHDGLHSDNGSNAVNLSIELVPATQGFEARSGDHQPVPAASSTISPRHGNP